MNNPISFWDPTGHAIASINVGGVRVGNGQISNGVATGNLEDIVKGLGGRIVSTTTKGVFSVCIPNAETGKDVTFGLNTNTGIAWDIYGNKLFDIKRKNNKIQVGVSQMAKLAGVSDTVSWWTDDKKQTNILVQPDMKGSAVMVTRAGDNITIKAYVQFTGDANNKFIDPSTGQLAKYTYANVVAVGIGNYWSGTFAGNVYDFSVGRKITVNTKIYSTNKNPNGLWTVVNKNSHKDFLTIDIQSNNGISNTQQDYNIGTGFNDLRTGNWDFDSHPWSVSGQGDITMYNNYNGRRYSQSEFARTAAHEFGHILGLDYAYHGSNSNRPEAKVTAEVPDNPNFYTGDMMRDNGYVSSNDVEMMWLAWSTNKFQYFMDYDENKKSSAIKIR